MKYLKFTLALFIVVVLAACKKKPVVPPVEDTVPPIILGVADVSIFVGDAFDPLAGVSASDDTDGVMTSKIVVTGTVNVNVEGSYVLTYTVTDEAGNKTEKKRTVVVKAKQMADLYIENGDFSEGFDSHWNHWNGDGGASTATIENGMLKYDVTDNGTQWYSNQVTQRGLTVTRGKTYKLTFDAKADIERGVRIKIETDGAPYTTYMDYVFVATTTMSEYTHEFSITNPTLTNAKFIIGIGNMAAVPNYTGVYPETAVYFDNFLVEEVDLGPDVTKPTLMGVEDKLHHLNMPFDPLEGVSVSDDRDDLTVDDIVVTGSVDVLVEGEYEITYTVKDKAGNETVVVRKITVTSDLIPSNLVIINGDFEVDQSVPLQQPAETGWGWHGAGAFTANIKEGVANIHITDVGNVPFGVQFYQQNRIVDKDFIYEITFKARADIPRPIMFALESGTTRKYDEVINITDTWATYTIIYKHEGEGFTNGKFAFFLGLVEGDSVPTLVQLDDVAVKTIAEFTDVTAPIIIGANDIIIKKGSPFDQLAGIKVIDNHDRSIALEEVAIMGELDLETVGVYTLSYNVTDSSGNETTVDRQIEVVEELPYENSFVMANNDFSTEQTAPVPQPATTGWGWHAGYNSGATFTVTMPGGVDGVATIDVTAIGNVPHGVQFYQQNKVVEENGIYEFSFKMKASVARNVRLSLESGTDVRWFKVIDVTTDWVTYTVEMMPSGKAFNNGKIAFFLGKVDETSEPAVFEIDDVVITLLGYRKDTTDPLLFGVEDMEIPRGVAFDPLAGVRLFDLMDKTLTLDDIVVTGSVDVYTPGVYELTYTLDDRSGNTVSVVRKITVMEGLLESRIDLINTDFSTEQTAPVQQPATTGWGWHGAGTFTVTIAGGDEGTAVIDITNPGNDFFGVQFYQQNKIVDLGSKYKITFRAKSTVPRTMQFSIEGGGGANPNEYVWLTETWTNYTFFIENQKPTFNTAKVAFFLGRQLGYYGPSQVEIDDVHIETVEEIIDTEAPFIFGANITIKQNQAFDPRYGLSVYDNIDKALTVNDIVASPLDTSMLGDHELTYTLTDASNNVRTFKRTITVIDEAAFNENGLTFANHDFSTEQTAPVQQPSTTGWGWHGAGAFTVSMPGGDEGTAVIDVTNMGTVPHGVQFYQQNKTIETGGIYMMTFKMKASVARNIRLSLEAGTNLRWFEVLDVTTEWATYTVIITSIGSTYTNGKMAFFLGKVDDTSVLATFEIDDVNVTLLGYQS